MDNPTPKIDVNVWSDSNNMFPEIQDRLRAEGFKGILIVGPDSVDLDTRRTVPFIGFRLHDTVEEAASDFKGSAIVTVVRLESNEIFAGTVFVQRDDQPRKRPLVPPKAAYVSAKFSFDLRSQIEDLPFRAGTLLTTVLLFDRRSNRVRTRISAGPAAERDPAVVEFLKKNRQPEPPPETILPPLPKQPAAKGVFPLYAPTAGTPPIPKEPGIALSLERVVVAPPGKQGILRGSFRLPSLAREIVPPNQPTPPGGRAYRDVGDPKATAVVPITLVLTGELEAGPFIVRLRVPSYSPIPAGVVNPMVEGSFNLDLFALDTMPQTPGTYYLWVFSGEHLSGPMPFSIVTQEMLRSD